MVNSLVPTQNIQRPEFEQKKMSKNIFLMHRTKKGERAKNKKNWDLKKHKKLNIL